MKTTLFTLSVICALAFVTQSFTPSPALQDSNTASITWIGRKVTGQHSGTIDFQAIALDYDKAGGLIGAAFTVDMNSMVCTDIEGEGAGKLVGHLLSDDFFGVEAHPTSTFKSTEIKSNGDGKYTITGDLMIKGKTEAITFDASVMDKDGMKHASATLMVDRTAYGIKYGSSSFFDGLKDKAIDNEFELQVTIVSK